MPEDWYIKFGIRAVGLRPVLLVVGAAAVVVVTIFGAGLLAGHWWL